MPIELTLLIWSTALFALYIGAQSTLYRLQYGVQHAAGARDSDPAPPSPMLSRAQRALNNLLETYPVFVALAVASVLAERSDWLTEWGAQLYFWGRIAYLPLYLLGVQYVRSMVWLVVAAGLAMMFFGVAF